MGGCKNVEPTGIVESCIRLQRPPRGLSLEAAAQAISTLAQVCHERPEKGPTATPRLISKCCLVITQIPKRAAGETRLQGIKRAKTAARSNPTCFKMNLGILFNRVPRLDALEVKTDRSTHRSERLDGLVLTHT